MLLAHRVRLRPPRKYRVTTQLRGAGDASANATYGVGKHRNAFSQKGYGYG